MQNYWQKDVTLAIFLYAFFCSRVCQVEKKKFNCFSSKWENVQNKWETGDKKSMRNLVSEVNPVEFGMNEDYQIF